MLSLLKSKIALRLGLSLLAAVSLTGRAEAARQTMPVGQRLENLRGNRKIDTQLIRSLTTVGLSVHGKRKTRVAKAAPAPAHEVAIVPVSGYGVEARYDRLMSALQRRHLQIVEASIRHGRGLILLRLRTTQERDDLVDIMYRSQHLIQTASAVNAARSVNTRYARSGR